MRGKQTSLCIWHMFWLYIGISASAFLSVLSFSLISSLKMRHSVRNPEKTVWGQEAYFSLFFVDFFCRQTTLLDLESGCKLQRELIKKSLPVNSSYGQLHERYILLTGIETVMVGLGCFFSFIYPLVLVDYSTFIKLMH